MDNSVLKAEALRKAEEANALCISENLSDKKQGVELFLKAQKIEWSEEIRQGGLGWTMSIPCSDEFLGACQSLAIDAFNNANYEEAMKYCEYVRNSYSIAGEDHGYGLGTSLISHSIGEYLKKRSGDFSPEMVCAEVEIALCTANDSQYYNLQEALYKKRRAAALGSIRAIKMLGEHYYKAAVSLEEAKEAYFFYSLLNDSGNQELMAKKKAAWDKYVSMMTGSVTYVFANSPTWMPPVTDADMTWERYSGLTEEVREKLPRKAVDNRMVILSSEEVASKTINGIGAYQSGVIDLEALWQQFVNHPSNQKVDKQILCFKKKKYNCNLYLGDFVDCCKYLWEQTYKKN